jgi:hypothetical protein
MSASKRFNGPTVLTEASTTMSGWTFAACDSTTCLLFINNHGGEHFAKKDFARGVAFSVDGDEQAERASGRRLQSGRTFHTMLARRFRNDGKAILRMLPGYMG